MEMMSKEKVYHCNVQFYENNKKENDILLNILLLKVYQNELLIE